MFVFLGSHIKAQAPAPSQAPSANTLQNTTLIDPSLVDKKQVPFQYQPVDEFFWNEIRESAENDNYINLVLLGSKQIKNFGADSDEAFEGHLAVGIGLRNLKLYFAATKVFSNVIKKRLGSQIAQKALQELSSIAQENSLDKLEFGDDLLVSNEFGIIHPDLQSFVSFYNAFFNLVNGQKVWADKDFSQIQPNSYWAQKVNYYKALSEVARGLIESAEARLYTILNNPKIDTNLKNQTQLQIARIEFEKKEYANAAQLYLTLGTFPPREKGRLLLEIAWTKYYLRDYSKALGILYALKAPMFDSSISPERYVLEMIMFKQLCYFNEVSRAATEFQEKFGPSIAAIKARKDLKNDFVLTSMAMQDYKLQYVANLINMLRSEYDEFREYSVEVYPDFKNILAAYQLKDKELQQRLYEMMDSKIPEAADQVLDVEEQIKFLDYTAKLDALRILKKGQDQEYRSEKISYIKFDKVYWPIVNEFWVDELDEYKVLIDSRCDQSLPTLPSNRELIKKFGDEFK